MLKYGSMTARQRKWMLYLLATFILGAGVTPFTTIFLGLLLGSVISFYNLWLLQKKIDDFGEAVGKGRKVRGLGTVSRFAAVAFGVIIALRFEVYFDIIAYIIGLMTSYLVIMIEFIAFKKK